MRKILLGLLAVFFVVNVWAGPDNNSLLVGTTQEPDNLNQWEGSADTKENALSLFFLGLTYFDNNGTLQPGLAERVPTVANGDIVISRNPDGSFVQQEVTWTIRNDATWSDGTPITTDDVLFTFEVQTNPLIPVSSSAFSSTISEIKKNGDKTFTIVYNKPNLFSTSPGGKIGLARFYDIAPKHVWEPIFRAAVSAAEADPDNASDIITAQFIGADPATAAQGPVVTSGAFVMDQWQPTQFMRAVRNDNFVLGPAKLDTVQVQFIVDQNTLLANIINGTLDASDDIGLAGLDPAELEAQSNGLYNVKVTPSGFIEHLNVNLHPECQDAQDLLLGDKRTRQALIQAINREELHQIVFPGSVISTSFVVAGDIGFLPETQTAWPFNPDAARALLADLGWADSDGDGVLDRTTDDGRKVDFVLDHVATPAQFRQDTQAILEREFADVGIKMNIISQPGSVVFAGPFIQHAAECTWRGLFEFAEAAGLGEAPFDPLSLQLDARLISNADSAFGGNNVGGINIPALQELIIAAEDAFDTAERAAIVEDMQRIFLDELPLIPLYERTQTVTFKTGLKNYGQDTPLTKTIFFNPWEWEWE